MIDTEILLPCVVVPAGPFLMGTPDAERSVLAKRYGGTRESYAEEAPQHSVGVPAFAMMTVPVTNELYSQYVRATRVRAPITWRGEDMPPELAAHPVVDVSWDEAQAFSRWLGAETGTTWSLPTEAQWEKAARGTDGRQFPWGNTFDPNYCNVRQPGRAGTTPVGSYLDGASPFGILDMAGNVWEWTRSLQASYPYLDDERNDVSSDAKPPRFWTRIRSRLRWHDNDANHETRRVLRGGCYANPEGFARCACRFRLAPTTRTPFVGFRLVRELDHQEREYSQLSIVE
jgi:toxoflavin biosynthesis protein ToxD